MTWFSCVIRSLICLAQKFALLLLSTPYSSQDLMIVPLTSKTATLLAGEFVLAEWQQAGLNVETAVKRGIYTIHESLVVRKVGKLTDVDGESLEKALRSWLSL